MSAVEQSLQTPADQRIAGPAPLVSVVIPCLNEEENIEECVRAASEALLAGGISGEVLVVDNASEDRSAELAAAAGARVILERRRGYGSAYLARLPAAPRPDILVGHAGLHSR